MPTPLQLSDFSELYEDGVLYLDDITMETFWTICLAMAVKDHATSLNWQPEASDHLLSYTIGSTRYELVPPEGNYTSSAFKAAQRLISPGLRGWLNRQVSQCGAGVLQCDSKWGPSICHGTWWSTGKVTGVDFVRLDPFSVPEQSSVDVSDKSNSSIDGNSQQC